MEHDLRVENMEEGYLSKPENIGQNINTVWQDLEEKNVKHFWLTARSDYLDRWGRALPENTRPIISGLISFSETMIEDIHKYGKELLNEKVNQFLIKKFGRSMVYNTLQCEEKTPHFQLLLLNYNFDTHRSISNTIDTEKLQDEIADFLKKEIENFDYVRGVPKEVSHAEHLEVRQAQQIEMKKQEKQISGLNEEVEELEQSKLIYEQQIQELQNKNIELKDQQEVMSTNIKEAKSEIQELEERLTSIIDDIIQIGEESKGNSMLKTMKKYVAGEKSHKLEQLIKKANRIKNALNRSISPGGY